MLHMKYILSETLKLIIVVYERTRMELRLRMQARKHACVVCMFVPAREYGLRG